MFSDVANRQRMKRCMSWLYVYDCILRWKHEEADECKRLSFNKYEHFQDSNA